MSSAPSTSELVALGAAIELRDGSRVRVRQGRPADRGLLLRGFQRLSDESRYRRFLAPMPELSEGMVRHLTEVDHHDHEAIIASTKTPATDLGSRATRARAPGCRGGRDRDRRLAGARARHAVA